MIVRHIQCGSFATASEENALRAVSNYLSNQNGSDEWYVLTNVLSSVTHAAAPDEIDMLVIGPTGLYVIEVKHWLRSYLKEHPQTAEREAQKLNEKIKRLLGKIPNDLRRRLPRIDGRFVLTAESSPIKGDRPVIAGSTFFSLAEFQALIAANGPQILSANEARLVVNHLKPISVLPEARELKQLGQVRDLQLQYRSADQFQRVYKGVHTQNGERLILHLFDLSARDTPQQLEKRARREVDALRQLHEQGRWVPQIADTYQDVANYAGELKFYTLFDPCTPSIKERAKDLRWTFADRLAYAIQACEGLRELHASGDDGSPFVHRNITPETMLVRHDNRPLFTSFEIARVPGQETIAKVVKQIDQSAPWIAPEIIQTGISAADQSSDVYALCYSLASLFKAGEKPLDVLQQGMLSDRNLRKSLLEIIEGMRRCQVPANKHTSEAPSPQFWSPGLSVEFKGTQYRVGSPLGKGSFGATYQVAEVKADSQDGAWYVGKVAFDPEHAKRMIAAYQNVRPIIGGDHLAYLYEYALEWNPKTFVALLKHIDGQSAEEWRGYFAAVADDAEKPPHKLAMDWIQSLLEALSRLHRAGYVHGDVSPRNIIIDKTYTPILTDYDLVTAVGNNLYSSGTTLYAAPESGDGQLAQRSHDVFALAASLYEVIFDRDAFMHDGNREKPLGLNWEGVDRGTWAWVPEFMDRATHRNLANRFGDAQQALDWISELNISFGQQNAVPEAVATPAMNLQVAATDIPIQGSSEPVSQFSPREVPWLGDLLTTYPASQHGNVETRGLDSDFARKTYVKTALDDEILKAVLSREVQLVILCGNAGDGKTAFMQNLASALGLPSHTSADRVWSAPLENGLQVMFNFDGAASFNGRSADDLLDEIFAPFIDGRPAEGRAHFVAINNGRLLEWIESGSESRLKTYLRAVLLNEHDTTQALKHVRYVDLNLRSLVGNVDQKLGTIDSHFIEALLESLIGGEQVAEIWQPCRTCTAATRCTANASIKLLSQRDSPQRQRVIERLVELLQTVHQRGRVHITTRELRAALTFIYFGVHYCKDLHEDTDLAPASYWDRTFDSNEEHRQGPLLTEMISLDPALDSHSLIDRYLVSRWKAQSANAAPQYPDLNVGSARRRAYFEWTPDEISQVGESSQALSLFQGNHQAEFARVAFLSAEERRDLCRRLCMGIASLESLPQIVLDRLKVDEVPLKILPRTPVESVLWVEKVINRFEVLVSRPAAAEHIDWLHDEVELRYQYLDASRRPERLRMNSALFSLLLDLADGYQLIGESSQDAFANLSVFTQRLAEETQDEIFAWEPSASDSIYLISIDKSTGSQRLQLTKVEGTHG